jgi:hypothetical protein
VAAAPQCALVHSDRGVGVLAPRPQASWVTHPTLGRQVEQAGVAVELKALGQNQARYCSLFFQFQDFVIRFKIPEFYLRF